MGDLMGHDAQIDAARNAEGVFNYDTVFSCIKPIISEADIAIANLEVTLAGPAYKGYPQFSSPDALAIAAKKAGIDVFGTANNHSLDRRKQGVERTIDVLDSLQIMHTGTFKNQSEKQKQPYLWLEKNGFSLAVINYTYGTNGIPVSYPNVVNIIDQDSLKADILNAKAANPDKVILFIHWGIEYQHKPNGTQTQLAEFCFNAGADIIIGSHPHVIQKSIWVNDSAQNQSFVTYSLGNLVSNQRKQYTDGGQMIQLTLAKNEQHCFIKEAGFFLTWVYTPVIDNKKQFIILPCADYELKPEFFDSSAPFNKMKLFISDSRNLLNSQNSNVSEYLFFDGKWSKR
jgi:poly-gamma-glutamate synthesis protein (capsule biosynthesis protein)